MNRRYVFFIILSLLLITTIQVEAVHCNDGRSTENEYYHAIKIQDYEDNTIQTTKLTEIRSFNSPCDIVDIFIVPTRQGSENQFYLFHEQAVQKDFWSPIYYLNELIINQFEVKDNEVAMNAINGGKLDSYEGFQFDNYVNNYAIFYKFDYFNQNLIIQMNNYLLEETDEYRYNITEISNIGQSKQKRSWDFGNFIYDEFTGHLFFGMYGPKNDPDLSQLVQINLDDLSLVATYPLFADQIFSRNTVASSILVKAGSSNTTIIALNPENRTITTLQQFNQKIETRMMYNFEHEYFIYFRDGTLLEVDKDTLNSVSSYNPNLITMTEKYKIKLYTIIMNEDHGELYLGFGLYMVPLVISLIHVINKVNNQNVERKRLD